jgi:hypothetical protein
MASRERELTVSAREIMEQEMKAMKTVAILAAFASVAMATTADARGRHGGGGKSFGIGAKSIGIGGNKHHFRHRYHSFGYVVPFCQEWKFFRTRFGLKKVCVFY